MRADSIEGGSTSTKVWGVQDLLAATADALSTRFGATVVEGELSGFMRAASGHCYMNLKDATGHPAMIRCAMFRRAASLLGFAPKDGMRVQVRGRMAVYESRGELQMVVEAMALAGQGSLYEQFLALKSKLQQAGWFDASRKRALPPMVQTVAVVTSLGAAALHDVTRALARRSPHVRVVVVPTLVQGVEAPPAIVRAIEQAQSWPNVDVVLLVRGGGSLEDLWAFNDERVVKAVASCDVPIVVGVGHESDITLADLAADMRAATPTAAAEIAVPETEACLDDLQAHQHRARLAMMRRLEAMATRVDRAAMAATRPARVLGAHGQRLRGLDLRLVPSLRAGLERAQSTLARHDAKLRVVVERPLRSAHHGLERAASRLSALDPARVLTRGYAWVTNEQGMPLVSARQASAGDPVRIVWSDGQAEANVSTVNLQALVPSGEG